MSPNERPIVFSGFFPSVLRERLVLMRGGRRGGALSAHSARSGPLRLHTRTEQDVAYRALGLARPSPLKGDAPRVFGGNTYYVLRLSEFLSPGSASTH